MSPDPWQSGLLVAAVVVHLLLAYRTYQLYSGSTQLGESATTSPGRGGVDRDERLVECPACGTENQMGYRFCRSCVETLPGAVGLGRGGRGPPGRTIR